MSPSLPVTDSNILLPKNFDKLLLTSVDKLEVCEGLHDSNTSVGIYSTVVTTSTLNVSLELIPVNNAYIGDLVQYEYISVSVPVVANVLPVAFPYPNIRS